MPDVAIAGFLPLVIDLGDGTYIPVIELLPAGGTPVAQGSQQPLIVDNEDGTCTPIMTAAA